MMKSLAPVTRLRLFRRSAAVDAEGIVPEKVISWGKRSQKRIIVPDRAKN